MAHPIDNWEPPAYLSDPAAGLYTEVNGSALRVEDWYLNFCRDCGWAGDVALWFKEGGPFCPRCKSNDVGRLVPEKESD